MTLNYLLHNAASVPLPASSSSAAQEHQSRSRHHSTSNTFNYCTLQLGEVRWLAAAGVSCLLFTEDQRSLKTVDSCRDLRRCPMVVMTTDAADTGPSPQQNQRPWTNRNCKVANLSCSSASGFSASFTAEEHSKSVASVVIRCHPHKKYYFWTHLLSFSLSLKSTLRWHSWACAFTLSITPSIVLDLILSVNALPRC